MYIKYNDRLKSFSKQFRSKPTPAEDELWKYLRWQFPEFKFNRQKPLDNFIVDFYCKEFGLVIEVDGEVHDKQRERDQERDNILVVKYALTVIRFTNDQVVNDKNYIREVLKNFFYPNKK